MNVSKRSEHVFQLSLTEIAFTIAFILLLLLGYLVMRESDAKKKAEEALAKVQDLGATQQALDEALGRLKEALRGAGSANPDEVISRLVADAKVATEYERLLVRVKDLEAQISALSEVKQAVADAAKEVMNTKTVDQVMTALLLQSAAEQAIKATADAASASKRPSPEATRAEVRRSLHVTAAFDRALRDSGAKPLPAGKEAATVAAMVRAAQSLGGLEGTEKGVEAVLKENADLRGQMANMRNRFNAVGRGLDHPPCWADEGGNIEYLFNVELRPGVAIVAPAWPERRRQDAEKIPGVSELTSGPMTPDRFRAAARPILDISKRQDPECRHFVVINNTIEIRLEADRARWMVEEFFYKREARR